MGSGRALLDGLHILLAEDNATNQMVAMQMLESLGATVTLASDGAEAIAAAEREGFDLALIDIEMPRVSGTDVIRRIREGGGPGADMPLIALTAYVMREHRDAIDAAGADGVIAKPILAIDQLGKDILRLARSRLDRAAMGSRAVPERAPEDAHDRSAAHAMAGGSGTGAAPGPGRIDRGIYDSLVEAIGAETLADLLEKVEADLVNARDDIERGLMAADMRPIRVGTHVVVSVAGSIGAREMQRLAECLNSAAHARQLEEILRIAPEAMQELDGVIAFVRERRRR